MSRHDRRSGDSQVRWPVVAAALAARSESPAAFQRQCMSPGRSSRLARRAPRPSRCCAGFHHGLPGIVALASLSLAACTGDGGRIAAAGPQETAAPPGTAAPTPNPLRNVYFGDLHTHTNFSYDAFLNGTRATPDDAYRYAQGEPLTHAAGFEIRLDRPLDFFAVTDHASFLGMLPAMLDPEQEVSRHPDSELARSIASGALTGAERGAAYADIRAHTLGTREGLIDMNIVRSAWRDTIAAAERHNDPGRFTTFIAYEFTGSPENQNLHRNVIFRGSAAPEVPFSRLDSFNPEELWAWMDRNREAGIEALAIPHNSNGSNGLMFRLATYAGEPLDAAYAETRTRNEPLVEITQTKGTSDTHPALSPNDEWADFEIWSYRIGGGTTPSQPSGSYVREAYLNGLRLKEERGINPFRFGLVGATDNHAGSGAPTESDYFTAGGRPQRGASIPYDPPRPDGSLYSASPLGAIRGASGLTGVWAEENTRESIYDAFRRKETFATTGPRIRLRFFAGYDYSDDLADDPDLVAAAYANGVAMGGELVGPGGRVPRFLVWANRDPASNPLARVQVIKGWIDEGQAHERVYDVACSDGAYVNPETHRCPDNGATVDLDTCAVSDDAGDAELRTLWTDPDFDPTERAIYYVRVLENPSCRWSTWEAVRAGVEPRPDLPATIQERAWSSPIWVTP